MPRVQARFPNSATADIARNQLARDGHKCRVEPLSGTEAREMRFIGRIVVLVAAWSVVGTGLGVGLGALLWALVGPEGTSGLVIQAVSWAIFAHLLAGMFTGYWLLSDRSRQELTIPGAMRLVVECASIDDARAVVARWRELGAEVEGPDEGGYHGEQV